MKTLMPYVTGGVTGDWTDYVRAFADAGAGMVEIGLPFAEPTLDGATIQEATAVALGRGATLRTVLAAVADPGVPLVASTYANLATRPGFCARLADAGFTGLIVPDLPLEECAGLSAEAAAAGVDLALLAAPVTPDARLEEIGRRSRGFVYAVSVMGTTGERDSLSPAAAALAARLRPRTALPVLLGFGISTPAQAAEAARAADGVVVGAAVMRRLLDGAGPAEVGAYVGTLRKAMDGG